jgi:hypothetical protein
MKTKTRPTITKILVVADIVRQSLSDYNFILSKYKEIAFQMRNYIAITETQNLNAIELCRKFDELDNCCDKNRPGLLEISLDNDAP